MNSKNSINISPLFCEIQTLLVISMLNYKKSLFLKYLIPLIIMMLIALILGSSLIFVLVSNDIGKIESSIRKKAKKEFYKEVSFKHKAFTSKLTSVLSQQFSSIDKEVYKQSNSIHFRKLNMKKINEFANELLAKDPNILEFKVVNQQAKQIYALCNYDRHYSEDLGVARPSDVFGNENELYISETYLDLKSKERYNYLGRPIMNNNGGYTHYIMVRYGLDFITDSIKQQQVLDMGNFFVLDHNNILVAQSNGSLELNKYNQLSAEEQTMIANGKSGSSWENNLFSFYKNDLGWSFGLETSNQTINKNIDAKVAKLRADFNNAVYRMLMLIAFALLVITLIATLIGIKVAKAVTKPVTDLTNGVKKISSGDLNIKLESSSEDEIGVLTYAFNDMAQSIKLYKNEVENNADIIQNQAHKLKASNEELENYAHTVSHDLKSPLRNIANFSALLDRRYGEQLDENGKEYLDFIKSGVQRMQRTIEDILNYSKLDKDITLEDFEQVDLNEIVGYVEKDLQKLIEDHYAKINYQDLPQIYGHPTMLYSLFQNLISNGIKFKGENLPIINISCYSENNRLIVTVSDNGSGIENSDLKEIFKPFKRLVSKDKIEGSGIGLATVKKIVLFHEGTIDVRSMVESGTTFTMSFPEKPVKEKMAANHKQTTLIPDSLLAEAQELNGNGHNGNGH